MPLDQEEALKQIDAALAFYEEFRKKSRHSDMSDLPENDRVEVATRLQATIERLAPPRSAYLRNLERLMKDFPLLTFAHTYVEQLPGALRALRADYSAGYLRSIRELIHADLFGDFLEMADYLLGEGYKDPAAVLAGGVLEERLRKLCEKHGVPTTAAGRPKKSEANNTDLAGSDVYSKLDQKNVTAWLDLRNKAAHGRYGEYQNEQVSLMIQGVRDFVSRIPS